VALFGWTGTIIIARTLDQATFGKFTFVFGLLGMMMVVTDMGLGRVAIRGVLPDAVEPDRFAGGYVALRSILGLAGYLLAVGITVALDYPDDVIGATALAGLVVVVATASHAHEIVFQAHLRMQMVAVSMMIGRLGQLALVILVALRGGSLIAFVVPAIVAELVIVGIKIPYAHRLQSIRYSLRPRQWSAMLREALPLSIGFALATLAFRIDVVMLSRLDDFVAVGIYEIAFKFADVLHFVALSISAPILTVLVKAWPDDPTLVKETLERAGAFLALLGGGLISFFLLFAGPTIELLYGTSFAPADDAARLLVFGEVLSMFSVLGVTALTAMDRYRLYPVIALAGLTLNVVANLWAIPRWSFDGAAAVTVVTEGLVFASVIVLLARRPGLDRPRLGFVGHAVLASAGAIVIGWSAGLVLPWMVAATLSGAAYLTGCAVTGLLGSSGIVELLRRSA